MSQRAHAMAGRIQLSERLGRELIHSVSLNGTPFHEEIQCIPEFLWDAHDFGRDYPLVN